jgi:hypothetical protein
MDKGPVEAVFDRDVNHQCVVDFVEPLLTKARAKIQAADDGEKAIVRSYWRGRESALAEVLAKVKR